MGDSMNIGALLITTGAGLFFLIGLLINRISKNKKGLFIFSLALAFMVMIGLISFDLAPELIKNISSYTILNKIIVGGGSIFSGFLILKILDILIPHHHHDHHEEKDDIEEHNDNMYHIGLITSLALIIHNIIEGGAIYLNSIASLKVGLLMALGVGLHNIPLGMEICTTLNLAKKSLKKKIIPISLITLSTGLGAVLMLLVNIDKNIIFASILIGITIGMLTYLIIFELLKEIKKNITSIHTIIGLICGMIIVVISFII